MASERGNVMKALNAFHQEVEKQIVSMGFEATEETSLRALQGATVYYHRREVSFLNLARKFTRGGAVVKYDGPMTVDEMVRIGRESVDEDLSPSATPGEWTNIPVVDKGVLKVVKIKTEVLELMFIEFLNAHDVMPFEFKSGNADMGTGGAGKVEVKVNKKNGPVQGVVAEYLLVANAPAECAGLHIKKVRKTIGAKGMPIEAMSAGYLLPARVRKSAVNTGSMVHVETLRKSLNRLNAYERDLKENTEQYNKFVGSKKGSRINKEDFRVVKGERQGLRKSEIKRRRDAARRAFIRASNKIHGKLRSTSQKALINRIKRSKDNKLVNQLVASLGVLPPFDSRRTVVPFGLLGRAIQNKTQPEDYYQFVSENFGDAKFIAKDPGHGKEVATLYYRAYTSTRDVPTGYIKKLVNGVADTDNTVINPIKSGEKVKVHNMATSMIAQINNPAPVRDGTRTDVSMFGVNPTEKDLERYVMSAEVSKTPGEARKGAENPSFGFAENLKEEITKGAYARPMIKDKSGATVVMDGDPGRNYCTGADKDGKRPTSFRKPYLLYKSAFGKKGEVEKMES